MYIDAALSLPRNVPASSKRSARHGDGGVGGGAAIGRYAPPMGKISEFSLKDQIFLTAYRWRRIDPMPRARLDRVRELVEAGRIGSLAREHVSLMGSMTAPGRFVRDSAPELASRLRDGGVDIAFLVPV